MFTFTRISYSYIDLYIVCGKQCEIDCAHVDHRIVYNNIIVLCAVRVVVVYNRIPLNCQIRLNRFDFPSARTRVSVQCPLSPSDDCNITIIHS